MMQRFACVSMSDASHLPDLFKEAPDLVDVSGSMAHGAWGLGMWREGEMLTRKLPIRAGFSALPPLEQARVRQFVVMADSAAGLRSHRATVQPLRFRDWVFAVSGDVEDPAGFIARAMEALEGFGKPGPTLPELALTTLMHTLQRANALDRRPIREAVYQELVAQGVDRLARFAGGRDALRVAFALHLKDLTLVTSAGRRVALYNLRAGRPGRGPSWSATVVTDQLDVSRHTAAGVFDWSGVRIDDAGAAERYGL